MTYTLTQEEVKKLNKSKVSNTAFRVYTILRSFCFGKKYFAFPGQKRLAEEIGVTVRTIQNAINELISKGLISKIRRGLNKTNIYVFTILAEKLNVQIERKLIIEEVEKNERGEKTHNLFMDRAKNIVNKKNNANQYRHPNNWFANYGGQRKYDLEALVKVQKGEITYEEFIKRSRELEQRANTDK